MPVMRDRLAAFIAAQRADGAPQFSVRSRGDEYRQYQRTTSAFIPWFPKETA